MRALHELCTHEGILAVPSSKDFYQLLVTLGWSSFITERGRRSGLFLFLALNPIASGSALSRLWVVPCQFEILRGQSMAEVLKSVSNHPELFNVLAQEAANLILGVGVRNESVALEAGKPLGVE